MTRVVLAGVRHLVAVEQAADDGHGLLEPVDPHGAAVERDAGLVVLGAHVPGAEPEHEAIVGQQAERRGLAGERAPDGGSRC